MSQAIRTTLVAAAVALLSAAVLVALARPAHAAGTVEVRFVEPERFTDAGRAPFDRDRALESLAAHLRQLGQRLPDGQRLRVDVLDVDLAGEQVLRRGHDLRVLRGGADMPHIHLKWTLEQGGSALKSGEDRLTDLGYMTSRTTPAASVGDLPHEKRLLAQWFRARFEDPR
ncbi:MAG: DUF3016 domain-containing protein [Burkholderiales bacterium]|nr:DUF3016 domain-containing protein [Burkholderiales bacterium]